MGKMELKKKWSACGLRKADFWIIAAVLLVSFFSFAYSDLYVTGNRSWLYYSRPFLEFYDASYEWAGNYGANYLPSTFLLYAIWNLPLYLCGFAPSAVDEGSLPVVFWYKLLPVLFYCASAYLVYRIVKQVGCSEKSAFFCGLLFFTSPIGLFSQFIFSQYDIFTVFFVLLGIHSGIKEKKLFSALWFGIAATFKYYALLFFFPLLLLKEKRVLHIIKWGAISVLPVAVQIVPYLSSPGFRSGVFGFGMLNNAMEAPFSTYIGGINYMQVLCMFLIAWAYFVKPVDKADVWRWYLFFSCGICFALFALMTWNPQWLLMGVPFWAMSITINRNKEIHLWLDCAQAVLFYLIVSNSWYGSVDEQMMRGGIWSIWVRFEEFEQHLLDLLPVRGLIVPIVSAFFVILLIQFVFKHPRYTKPELGNDGEGSYRGIFRLRFFCGPVLYMLLCLAAIAKNGILFG